MHGAVKLDCHALMPYQPFMDLADDIRAIESALGAQRTPLSHLLRKARIDRSTWTRWRSGKTLPRLDRWVAVQAAVAALTDQGMP